MSTARLPEAVLIAMGSNVGDRAAHLDHAVVALSGLPGITVQAVSGYHETRPVGGPPQGPFLNAALRARTDLDPLELLEILLSIERERGRVRAEPNGPRVLDLDLILHGERIVNRAELTLPHLRAHQRPFVLEPAAEVAADLRHPVLERTIGELARALRAAGRNEGLGPLAGRGCAGTTEG